jgi:type I restriction enzyme R subunit
MEIKKGVEVKTVARYNQCRAVIKIIKNFREGTTTLEKGGVVWHTQGSGKSLTMVFLIRKIRSCDDLKDLKIIFTDDRTDLEEQLSDTAILTGEPCRIIDKRNKLHLLGDDTDDVNMVMIHKFLDEKNIKAAFENLLNYYDKQYITALYKRENVEHLIQKITLTEINPKSNAEKVLSSQKN